MLYAHSSFAVQSLPDFGLRRSWAMIDKVLEGSGWCRRISSTDIDRRNEKLAQLNHP